MILVSHFCCDQCEGTVLTGILALSVAFMVETSLGDMRSLHDGSPSHQHSQHILVRTSFARTYTPDFDTLSANTIVASSANQLRAMTAVSARVAVHQFPSRRILVALPGKRSCMTFLHMVRDSSSSILAISVSSDVVLG